VTISEKIIAGVFSWLFLLDELTAYLLSATGVDRGIGFGIAECCIVTGA
jgi:hypothetical protein